jgi:predicted site-specific integrase-resolvase
MNFDQLLSRKEFARELGVTICTIKNWETRGLIEAPIWIGKKSWWKRSELERITQDGLRFTKRAA